MASLQYPQFAVPAPLPSLATCVVGSSQQRQLPSQLCVAAAGGHGATAPGARRLPTRSLSTQQLTRIPRVARSVAAGRQLQLLPRRTAGRWGERRANCVVSCRITAVASDNLVPPRWPAGATCHGRLFVTAARGRFVTPPPLLLALPPPLCCLCLCDTKHHAPAAAPAAVGRVLLWRRLWLTQGGGRWRWSAVWAGGTSVVTSRRHVRAIALSPCRLSETSAPGPTGDDPPTAGAGRPETAAAG